MFAPVTNALNTLFAYVAVQGYLALLRYTHWVWRRKGPLMNKLIRFRVKLGATLGAINLGIRPNDTC